MSTLRIKDAPLLPDVDGSEKIPTGGRGDLAISMDQVKTFAQGDLPQQLQDHINDSENPHNVTKDQVGLGEVDNTSDIDKPISTATQEALDLKADKVYTDEKLNLKADKSTTYTKTEVNTSLGLKADKTYVDSNLGLKADKTYVDSNLGLKADKTNVYTRSETTLALSKKADLVNGVIPKSQIPNSFNYVLEFTTPNLPIVGESGKIYVTTDNNKTWRWDGNKYVEISGLNPDSVSKSVTLPTYYTKEAGVDPVTGVADGAYFNVRSEDDDTVAIEYQNIGGVATPSGKSYPSTAYVQNVAKHTALPFIAGKTYGLHERVQLDNGYIVKSTIKNNINNPNVDMTGWASISDISVSTNGNLEKTVASDGSVTLEVPTASDSRRGVVRQATSAEVANRSNVNAYITPSNIPNSVPRLTTASGNAPSFSARAWVRFNGSGAIQEGGNVSSVTRGSSGRYTVNFGTAMPNANYAAVSMAQLENAWIYEVSRTSSSITVQTKKDDAASYDAPCSIVIFA